MVTLAGACGGTGGPLLVMLHGLGATGAIWSGMAHRADACWNGRWMAPDLPGHGGSGPMSRYTIDFYAAHVAAAIADLPPGPVTILGHDLGGLIGLTLATGQYEIMPARVCALSIQPDGPDPTMSVAHAQRHLAPAERPDLEKLMISARCPVRLACGEPDGQGDIERLRDFDPRGVALRGASHAAMIDRPDLVWTWLLAAD